MQKEEINDKNGKKIDWMIAIPIILFVGCLGISLGKSFQMEKSLQFIDILEMFNSNAFSTFISMTACMMYQFFSDSKTKQNSRLSRKWISMTVIATIFYILFAVINACRFCLFTSILMSISSIGFIVLFFCIYVRKESIIFNYSRGKKMLEKIREVFTEEYKKETEYQEYMKKMSNYFKLNNNSEDVEKKVERLKNKKYVSDFKVVIGKYICD